MIKPEIIGNATLFNGDCLNVLPLLDKVDSVVTDPPYGLNFMGRGWDHGVPSVLYWEAVLDAMKPGAFLLAFGGTRTYHRLTCAIEDAGFEIRDCIMWVYGTGFPKSHNISKAIDKAAGVEREVVAYDETRLRPNRKYDGGAIGNVGGTGKASDRSDNGATITAPATPEAQQWDGWGTALKPAWEPIIVARKPFKGTVANNVLEHGTGGINIDGCRITTPDIIQQSGALVDIDRGKCAEGYDRPNATMFRTGKPKERGGPAHIQGRFPANLIHDGSDEVTELFPDSKGQQGEIKGTEPSKPGKNTYGIYSSRAKTLKRNDSGSAARFFYCAKSSREERGEGNDHPTVKPISLMRYLCRLVTPPDGTVLDSFMGSGSTGKGALLEGFKFVGIDNDEEKGSFEIACKRITYIQQQGDLFYQKQAHIGSALNE